ncbi:RNA-directed DNA polymerase, eukaryota, reverse transcriptase zinc-binding domain protein [Tanacetum coccineum]
MQEFNDYINFLEMEDICNAKFHPYVTSDHYPTSIALPSVMKKKIEAFSFVNYIAQKPEFLDIVAKECDNGQFEEVVDVMIILMSMQTILCLVETLNKKIRNFCNVVYAANTCTKRRQLWKDLITINRIVVDHPWIMLGDFNVILNTTEHSVRGSSRTTDMQEFNDRINFLEMEDVCSSGFFFTWIKSPSKPITSIIKKLDRVMANHAFISNHKHVDAKFHPYVTSYHCPTSIALPSVMKNKIEAFSFVNYIAQKPEFLDIVEKECDNTQIEYVFSSVIMVFVHVIWLI